MDQVYVIDSGDLSRNYLIAANNAASVSVCDSVLSSVVNAPAASCSAQINVPYVVNYRSGNGYRPPASPENFQMLV